MKRKKFDILIIGGGAAGLSAAIAAGREWKKGSISIGIIDRMPKTGKKLLATGNGRCNLSNADLSTDRYHGSCKSLLKKTETFSVPGFFDSLGVVCEDDGYGRIYPRCRSAASVLDALRLECRKLGVEEICGFEAKEIKRHRSDGSVPMFALSSDDLYIMSHQVILAGGGKSQSALGSNGSMSDICGSFGIKTAPFFPALVPLKTEPALVKPLKGQRADANVMFCADGSCIASERGEVQFTDGLLSGICVFDLSYLYEEYRNSKCELRLDLLPDMDRNETESLLKRIREIRRDTSPDDFLSGIFTRPLGIYILKRLNHKLPETTGKITDTDLSGISSVIKSLSFPVIGNAGYERSQVTGGGIVADEFDDGFAIKRIDGLYVCGEMLDIFGDCGGYNLDFAFSSGSLAGRSAALKAAKWF